MLLPMRLNSLWPHVTVTCLPTVICNKQSISTAVRFTVRTAFIRFESRTKPKYSTRCTGTRQLFSLFKVSPKFSRWLSMQSWSDR